MEHSYNSNGFFILRNIIRGFFYSLVRYASSLVSDIVSGSSSVMTYPNVLITNPTSLWQNSTSTITIPVSGIYHMDLMEQTGSSLGTMDISLTLNNMTILSRLFFTFAYSYITRCQPVMAYLLSNSSLAVSYNNVRLEGCNNNGLGIQGFLLYPD